MSLFRNPFAKKNEKINSYADFWTWFQSRQKDFYKVAKSNGNYERDFFRHLAPKLSALREGYFYLAGMLDDNTAELVITADGKIKNIVFVEELINTAPPIEGWKFTAHKPALDIKDVNIEMAGFSFNKDNLSFRPVNNPSYPDEIEITLMHPDLNEANRNEITNGACIYLDNFLGEIHFATTIDYLNVEKMEADGEQIPIDKLKDYLVWRQKEFIEKYEGVRHDTQNDNYSTFEATYENGKPVLATINTDLLKWDRKASHPWILKLEIKYNDSGNGMPDTSTYELMGQLEDQLISELKDADGYLNVGRQTADGLREVYFACREFRHSSKVTSDIILKYATRLHVEYDIYKDKYWRTFDRFAPA